MTTIINCFGGPGAGKSTFAARLFSELKILGVQCELVSEYAKDKVYEEGFSVLENQVYVFGKQYQRLYRVAQSVDIIITDAPLLNSMLYNSQFNNLDALVKECHDQFNNINFVVKRCSENYQQYGRIQTLDQAIDLDCKVKNLLQDNKIPHTFVGQDIGIDQVVGLLKEKFDLL